MRVSFNQTHGENVHSNNGFGYAANMCKDSLRELGHEVTWRDSTADVEINFIQPHHWHWTGPYRIGYLPWESTSFRDGWIDDLNECDEVWTPSPVIGQWMMDAGLKKTPHIYQHGVEPVWAPVKREVPEEFQVLHHGGEALRKGMSHAINGVTNVFANDNVHILLKMQLQQWNLHDTRRVWISKNKLPIEDLVQMYHDSHLLLYPSYGEGFGLAPLQAMATGMPVLITKGWAPYEYLLPEEMLIDSTLDVSPWQEHHPGKVFYPHQSDLEEKLRWLYENQEWAYDKAFEISQQVHRDYNWLNLTRDAFAHLTQ